MLRIFIWLLAIPAILLASAGYVWAAPPSPITEVTYPALSSNGNMDFWEIPWSPGEKLTGSFSLKVNARVRNLVVRPVNGGVSLDYASRNTIAKQYIRFSLPDSTVPVDSQTTATQPKVYDAGTYLFTFDVENIPADDTYLVELEAAGDVEGGTAGSFVPFVEKLPSLKLKLFAEPEISIVSGKQLTAQWTNQDAPWQLLSPLELMIDRTESTFLRRANPLMTVALTMPGRPHVDTTQTFDIQVTLDPVLDDKGNETPQVLFVAEVLSRKEAVSGDHEKPVAGLRKETVAVLGNETLLILISRQHTLGEDGSVKSTRIPPGVYTSQLHVHTAWGTKYDLPVEIRVRDNPIFAGVALIAGILVSLLAAYWQTRQPLLQAQLKARRWQAYYDEQGLTLAVVDRVTQRLNASIVAGDGAGATQAAGLLESLMRDLPTTLGLEAALAELQGLVPDSALQVWSLVTGASSVENAIERLKTFCASHPDPNVQQFGAGIASSIWHGGTKDPVSETQPSPPAATPPRGRERLAGWRVQLPSFWDAAIMIVMFVLVNGGLIALQMSQSYYQNETFGSTTDYMSLLLWGYAGDATRSSLSDLAAKVKPSKGASNTPTSGTGA